jgi:L-amino acid N-acyltransferase YncA
MGTHRQSPRRRSTARSRGTRTPAVFQRAAGAPATVALRDGTTVHVRAVRPEDHDAIRTFLQSMSADSLYLRCFGIPNVEWLADWAVDVDYADRYGVVVTSDADDKVVAHAAYVRTGGSRAEVAFEVADALQGNGIATLLLAHLASVAASNAISSFTAVVLPENYRMLAVFHDSGFPTTQRTVDGVTEVEMRTSWLDVAIRAYEERGQHTAIDALLV